MKCLFAHRYGKQEMATARLPLYDDSDSVLGSGSPEVTIYRQTCSRCGRQRAWCVTLDNQPIELNPDDRRVVEAFNKKEANEESNRPVKPAV